MTLDTREWLEADGLGGYAMGTASGVRTRRYHALLCAASAPPRGRMVLVNGLEVFFTANGHRAALSSHYYVGDVVHPDGESRIARFAYAPWPRWEFGLEDGSRVSKEILVPRGRACVIVRFCFRSGGASLGTGLVVRPLMSGRGYHALHHENPSFRFAPDADRQALVFCPYAGVPAISMWSNGSYHHAPDWYRSFVYTEERARGLDFVEDLATPGEVRFDLSDGAAVLVFAAGAERIGDDVVAFAEDSFEREAARRARGPIRGPLESALDRAAESYLVRGAGGETIIAGYPWFADWGRDTFIALRGLCLSTGRHEDGKRVLLAWPEALSEGMLPNRFVDEGGSPEYNSVDASLWFVIAADAFLRSEARCTSSERRTLEDAIDAIVTGYAAGTRHGISADEDGLLRAGGPGTQLTWMDARVNGREITPRVGKPVEVQALWINALAIAARRAPQFAALRTRANESFEARFWNRERRMLFDVVDVDHRPGACDDSFRPNQLFAIGGLPLQLLTGERAHAVVDACEAALLTPAGLRSLAPSEPAYTGRYRGGPSERDAAYHQGTVWTWLTGAFVEAWVRVRGNTPESRDIARRRFLDPLLARLEQEGLGHLAEIADGDPPHAPAGAPFQAWSVAEALRLDRDVLRRAP